MDKALKKRYGFYAIPKEIYQLMELEEELQKEGLSLAVIGLMPINEFYPYSITPRKHESIQAFKSGANITTVMGFASNATIKQSLEVAHEYDGEVMIDLLGIESAHRVKEIYELGARLFCLHVGKDMQQDGELATSSLFQLVEGLEGIRIAVAGGETEKTAPELLLLGVDILIVGSYITGSVEPVANAKLISRVIKVK